MEKYYLEIKMLQIIQFIQEHREFKIGYVPQYGGFFGDLTTYQNLKAVAEILN